MGVKLFSLAICKFRERVFKKGAEPEPTGPNNKRRAGRQADRQAGRQAGWLAGWMDCEWRGSDCSWAQAHAAPACSRPRAALPPRNAVVIIIDGSHLRRPSWRSLVPHRNHERGGDSNATRTILQPSLSHVLISDCECVGSLHAGCPAKLKTKTIYLLHIKQF